MTKDEARQLFEDARISYSDIGSKEIFTLRACIAGQLSSFNNTGFKMKLIDKMRLDFNPDGSLKLCEIRVEGWINNESPYFSNREAITFNIDGFVGFAGWAGTENVKPFVQAFEEWIESDIIKVSYKNL